MFDYRKRFTRHFYFYFCHILWRKSQRLVLFALSNTPYISYRVRCYLKKNRVEYQPIVQTNVSMMLLRSPERKREIKKKKEKMTRELQLRDTPQRR